LTPASTAFSCPVSSSAHRSSCRCSTTPTPTCSALSLPAATTAAIGRPTATYIYTDHSQWISASAGVSYRWLGTHFDADVIYGSGLREDSGAIPNGGAVAPYLQMNLGVSHRFSDVFGSPLELNAAVINVTDRIYEIRSGTGVGVLAPQYGPRRAFYAGFGRFF